MALPNNTRTYDYTYGAGTLTLQASLANLNALKEKAGANPFEYIFSAVNLGDPDLMVEAVRNVMFCLQAGKDTETEEAIHGWLFGSISAFFTEENIKEVDKAFAYIMGVDIAEKIPAAKSTKKKLANSTNLSAPSSI